ncbi:MAG: hypothetical protein JWM64_2766 [Frankiales bacterium]|nr:hypothetical protein [Frankiales bacterium]
MRLVVELQVPGEAGVAVLDALARLQLLARRLGGSVRVAGDGLDALAGLCGLSAVLGLEPEGQPQADEQLRSEEVVHVDDPVA